MVAESSLFTLVESDFTNPIFSSASDIRALNYAASQVAHFAGYDHYSSRLDHEGSASVVRVTRFSGDLLSILKVNFTFRQAGANNQPRIFISEGFWEKAFARRENIIGTQLKLNQTTYRIAGVTRPFNGLLDSTDIWLPVASRSALGRISSMKIIGALLDGKSWKTAEKQIGQFYNGTEDARVIPIEIRITFREASPGVFAAARLNTRPESYYQPAALPSRRGS